MSDNSSNGKGSGNDQDNDRDDDQDDHKDDHKDDPGKNGDQDKDNVIRIPSLAERDRLRKESRGKSLQNPSGHSPWGSTGKSPWGKAYADTAGGPTKEPFINLPPATKYLAASLILAYLATHFLLPLIAPSLGQWAMYHLSFIPARFTGELPFTPLAMITPVTYMWLHGGLMHIGLNTVMLVAFGAGIERWFGAKRLLLIFVLCGLFGLAFHFLFYPTSRVPVIGASGGISGFFAVILVMINQGRWRGGGGAMGGGIMPFAILWVVISILSAFLGSFGGGTIAWAAHIGGFLGGFLLMRPYLRK